jgi:PleD family two-component response regulator
VLSETNEAGALYVADRLKRVVTEAALPHPASPLSDWVTVCLGIATAEPTLEFAWEDLELLAAAGKALVLARQTGRDTVALSIAGCAPADAEE